MRRRARLPDTRTATINVESGETVTCVFTNTKDASLDIEKESFGGTATFDFTSSGTGLPLPQPTGAFTRNTGTANPTTTTPFAFTGLQSGDKYVSETPESGFTLTDINCTLGGAVILIGTGQGAGFAQGTSADFDPGDNSVKVTITAGDTPSCTFENTKNASLDIEKGSIGGTSTFDFTSSCTGLPTPQPTGAFTRNTAGANPTTTAPFDFTGFQLGDKYVSETPEMGYTLTDINCTLGDAVIVIGTGQGAGFVEGATADFDPGDNTVKVTVGAGDTPSCTFENTLGASLDIEKQSIGGTATFDFTSSGTGLPLPQPTGAFTRNTAGANPTTTLPSRLPGWSRRQVRVGNTGDRVHPDDINCTDGGAVILIGTGQGGAFNQGATADFDEGDNTVKVTVTAGDSPACTFENTKNASLDIEKRSFGGTETFDFTSSGSGLPLPQPTGAFTRNTAGANPTTTAPFDFTGFQLGDKYVSNAGDRLCPDGHQLHGQWRRHPDRYGPGRGVRRRGNRGLRPRRQLCQGDSGGR